MIWLLLALLVQDFTPRFLAKPMDYATANEVGKDVVVTVTYEAETPKRVCVATYDLEDTNFDVIVEQHCFDPTNPLGDFDVWENRDLESMGNILVTITYASGKTTVMYLVYQHT